MGLNKKKNQILMIGFYPPPIMGAGVHIKRLVLILNQKNISYRVFSPGKKHKKIAQNIQYFPYNKLFLKTIFDNSKIIHDHQVFINRWFTYPFFKISRKKLVFTLHTTLDVFFDSKKLKGFKKKIAIYFFKKYDNIIVVTESEKEELKKIGVKEEKILSIKAFIPPVINEADRRLIPKYVYEKFENYKFKLVAMAGIYFYNNQDLYGIDLLIDLIKKLREKKYDVGIVIAILPKRHITEKEQNYYNSLKEKVIQNNLDDFIYLYEVKDTELWPLLEKSDLFVRPTNTDGYAMSLVEAINLNIPSIASDICPRPEGTIIFKNRDLDDFILKVEQVLDNYQEYKERIKKVNIEFKTNSERILDVYEKLF